MCPTIQCTLNLSPGAPTIGGQKLYEPKVTVRMSNLLGADLQRLVVDLCREDPAPEFAILRISVVDEACDLLCTSCSRRNMF